MSRVDCLTMQMPRTYARTSARGNWTKESVLQALAALSEGRPLVTCARQYNIPRNTLRRHWLKKIKKLPGSKHLGRESTLGPDAENELVEYILKLEEKGFGLTPHDVREIAFDFAERNNLHHNFDKDQKMAGPDWWASFRKRHR